ncbi:MAG: hypothetical protein V3T86_08310 [Planctomycetota bacterium]
MKVATVFIAALMFGCGDKNDEGTHDGDGCDDHAGHEHEGDDHEGHDHADKGGESEIETAFKALSSEDQKLARAQKMCPVSSEELGSMGTPIKVAGGGRDVFLCCEGCRKRFVKNPEKYIKLLDK